MPKPENVPPCPGAPSSRSSEKVTKEYTIGLLTPLFGGGVNAGTPDASMPIRATSIRGHLEFWWRATRGAGYESSAKLFAAHQEVWGSTELPSPVEVSVLDFDADKPIPCARYEEHSDGAGGKKAKRLVWNSSFVKTALPYALFPFQGELPKPREGSPGKEPALFVPSASFVLRLRFPEDRREDVETAIKAWLTFGGLGARTRRGCGALFCPEITPKNAEALGEWLSGTAPRREWATQPVRLLVGQEASTPLAAWDAAIKLFLYFRQGVGFGRNPGDTPNHPGRSRYPEPDTIRRATTAAPAHEPSSEMPERAFPRAELGLPIVFHFKDQKAGDPDDTTLCPSGVGDDPLGGRMASPLILRPLRLDNRKFVPIIAHLSTPPLTSVELRNKDGRPINLKGPITLRGPHLASYRNSPLARTSGSAIEAFLKYAKANGFKEILP